jgi:hypothetical protein
MRIALAIGMLTLIGALPAAAAAPNAPPADPVVARLAGLNGNAFEVAFLQAVIPIDQESIELAMTATLYADHSELLRWNQTLVERKNDQVRKMLAWLQATGAARFLPGGHSDAARRRIGAYVPPAHDQPARRGRGDGAPRGRQVPAARAPGIRKRDRAYGDPGFDDAARLDEKLVLDPKRRDPRGGDGHLG